MAEPVPRVLIYLPRRDLRVSDNPVFKQIAALSASPKKAAFTHLLPIYVFAAKQIEISGFIKTGDSGKPPKSPYPEARSSVAGFWRCGPHRAKFLAESVWDLKKSLECAGSGLTIRVGPLEDVIKGIFAYFEGKRTVDIYGVWMTGEVAFEELQEERKVRRIVEEHGKEFRLFPDEKFFVDEYDNIPLLLCSGLHSLVETSLSKISKSSLTYLQHSANRSNHYARALANHSRNHKSYHHCLMASSFLRSPILLLFLPASRSW